MFIELYNADIKPIVIKTDKLKFILNPCESQTIYSNGNISMELSHTVGDKFNSMWYILTEIFELKQMRTVLVVDGVYTFKQNCENNRIKIKSYEYVFDKNTSYDTFVFATNSGEVVRNHLHVVNADKILKRSKWLYLFGGKKSFLPMSAIALFSSLIKLLFLQYVPGWFLIMIILLCVIFILSFSSYLKSLYLLRRFITSDSIFKFLSSERKEYRKYSDDLNEKYRNKNAGSDLYN